MVLLKKILLLYPIALASCAIALIPLYRELWIKPMLLAGVLIWGLFQREIYLEEGILRKRKRLEMAICVLLLLFFNQLGTTFQFWPYIPVFLFFVWLGFSIVELFFLVATFVVASFGLGSTWFPAIHGSRCRSIVRISF